MNKVISEIYTLVANNQRIDQFMVVDNKYGGSIWSKTAVQDIKEVSETLSHHKIKYINNECADVYLEIIDYLKSRAFGKIRNKI